MGAARSDQLGARGLRARRGVTLLELVLALGLVVLVAAMMFSFYAVTLRTRERGRIAVNDGFLAQRVAHQIAEEVRACNGFVSSMGPGIAGTDRFISIQYVKFPGKHMLYRRSVTEEKPPAECDIRQVQYYLGYDREELYDPFVYPDGTEGPKPLGLVRREIKTPFQTAFIDNDPKSVALDLISEELKYVRFRYFDGVDWTDFWDIGESARGANSLPQAVEITVGYRALKPPEEEEEENPAASDDAVDDDSDLTPALPEPYASDTYTITVRLHQADTFFGSRLMRAQRGSRSSRSEGGA